MSNPKHTHEYIKNYFAEQGCELLSPEYKSNKATIEYRCKCGQVNQTCFNNFSRGFRCRNCYLTRFEEGRKQKEEKDLLRQKLFNMAEAARELGVPYEKLYGAVRKEKKVIPPEKTIPNSQRKYYDQLDLDQIKTSLPQYTSEGQTEVCSPN